MITHAFSGLLLILLLSSTKTAGTSSWCKDCGPLQLEGPINGVGPTLTSMPVIQANCSESVNVTCQMNLTDSTATFSDYSSRLQMSITADNQHCTLLHGNGSDQHLGGGCHGIKYTYYEAEIDDRSKNFSYYINQISRLDKSIVSCGVYYNPDTCPGGGDSCWSNCIAATPALIQLQGEQECVTTQPTTTTAVPTTPPTTTETAETTTKTTTSKPTTHTTTVPPTETTTLPPTETTTLPPTETTIGPPTDTTVEPDTTTTEGLSTVFTLPAVGGEIVVPVIGVLFLILVVSLIFNVVLINVAIRLRRKNRNPDTANGYQNYAFQSGTLKTS